jgi:hypothetical protein
MWDFVMDKSGAGAGFLRVLRFPLQSSFHQFLHNHLHYIGQEWPQCQLPHKPNKKKCKRPDDYKELTYNHHITAQTASIQTQTQTAKKRQI